MAQMMPPPNAVEIQNEAEKEVYEALRSQLPPDWVVRYDYSFVKGEGRFVRDGQADFIIMAPSLGVMVLEVKGSHGYDCQDGAWYRIDNNGVRRPTKSPFEQACDNKFQIVRKILCPALGLKDVSDFPGIFGYAVVYPKGRLEGKLPASTDPVVMMAHRHMDRLHAAITDAFARWGSAKQGYQFTNGVLELVRDTLADNCRIVTVESALADDTARRIEELTEMQFQALRGVFRNPRVQVEGPAGSGKTVLATWRAQSFVRDGQKVAFLCFNNVLAETLRRSYGERGRLEIRTFHELCRWYASQTRIEFEPPGDDVSAATAFWSETCPTLLSQAVDQLGDEWRYDAVVVDEAQDFDPNWWLPVQLLLKDPNRGPLYIFLDPLQRGIYGQEGVRIEGVDCVYELQENCRNTIQIARFCGSVVGADVRTFPRAATGQVPMLLEPVADEAERAHVVTGVVKRWIQQDEAGASRIAVLSPWSRNKSCLRHLTKVAGRPIVSGADGVQSWMNGKAIWTSTIKSFKGMEADFVLVTDLPRMGGTGYSKVDLYVAASRARHSLVLLPASPEAYQELRNWLR